MLGQVISGYIRLGQVNSCYHVRSR